LNQEWYADERRPYSSHQTVSEVFSLLEASMPLEPGPLRRFVSRQRRPTLIDASSAQFAAALVAEPAIAEERLPAWP
jgi:hypothetical protein